MPNVVLQNELRSANIRARVPEEIKRRWQDAAFMRGQTLTDFLIVAANKETAETFLENEHIELSQRDKVQLAEMLSRPPRVNEAMWKAMQKRLENMTET
ncbi:MAG: DUF1778 domain-containing protein [Synergistaceae bacterium]|nr:DUF1778 domain-containing protein [Synergistaceae bacterium]